jgi:RNA polymerase sigma-70 factor (ECF subfamily)
MDMEDGVTNPTQPGGAEAELLTGLRAQDPLAYEQLVREHCNRLLAVARRILHNEDDAHEAVQDAFLSAFRGLPSFYGNAGLSTWLHRIAVNAALMKLRRRPRRAEISIDELLPTFLDDGHQVNPASLWHEEGLGSLTRQETCQLVRDCIERLPEAYRVVLVLRDLEEFDTEETARLLEVNPGVVKTRLHRARMALRALLDPHVRGEAQ